MIVNDCEWLWLFVIDCDWLWSIVIDYEYERCRNVPARSNLEVVKFAGSTYQISKSKWKFFKNLNNFLIIQKNLNIFLKIFFEFLLISYIKKYNDIDY